MAKTPTLFTIGYEGVTADALVATLKAAGVEVLIDVRAVPLSRKAGLSKNKLAAKLAEKEIKYIGLKNLGTPSEGRDAARKGKTAEMRRIFEAHLETQAAKDEMEDAIKIASANPSCLLCFEHEPKCCHRLIVAERMAERTGQEIEHLNPEMGHFLL